MIFHAWLAATLPRSTNVGDYCCLLAGDPVVTTRVRCDPNRSNDMGTCHTGHIPIRISPMSTIPPFRSTSVDYSSWHRPKSVRYFCFIHSFIGLSEISAIRGTKECDIPPTRPGESAPLKSHIARRQHTNPPRTPPPQKTAKSKTIIFGCVANRTPSRISTLCTHPRTSPPSSPYK